MRATIIVDDNLVIVNGKGHAIDCSSLVAQRIHAVQWYDGKGEIEYVATLTTDSDGNDMWVKDPNEMFTDISRFQSIIDAWQFAEDHPPPPPTPDPEAAAELARIVAIRDDVDRQDLLEKLKTATPQQIKTYINNNVTDLASARVMLMKLTLLVASVIRR